jgi:hypothetical protein
MNVTWRNSGKFDKEAISRGCRFMMLPVVMSSIITYMYYGWIPPVIIVSVGIISVYFMGKHTKSMYCPKHDCLIKERRFDFYDVEYYCPKCSKR